MPLKAAASKLEPSSQSPHMPALPSESNIQGIPGVLVGRAAPLHFTWENHTNSDVSFINSLIKVPLNYWKKINISLHLTPYQSCRRV